MATETTLQITGMECSHCAQRLGQAVERTEG
jgi:copper chaperone CopZ